MGKSKIREERERWVAGDRCGHCEASPHGSKHWKAKPRQSPAAKQGMNYFDLLHYLEGGCSPPRAGGISFSGKREKWNGQGVLSLNG